MYILRNSEVHYTSALVNVGFVVEVANTLHSTRGATRITGPVVTRRCGLAFVFAAPVFVLVVTVFLTCLSVSSGSENSCSGPGGVRIDTGYSCAAGMSTAECNGGVGS